jgi:hypothetical protein
VKKHVLAALAIAVAASVALASSCVGSDTQDSNIIIDPVSGNWSQDTIYLGTQPAVIVDRRAR